jgi:hypothetical protein
MKRPNEECGPSGVFVIQKPRSLQGSNPVVCARVTRRRDNGLARLAPGLRSCRRFTLLESTWTESSQDFGTRFCSRKITTWGTCLAEGCVYPLSQFRIVVLSQPMILATSVCSNPKSSRLFRIACPMVLISVGYALSLGFLSFKRTRQKSNATSTTRTRTRGQGDQNNSRSFSTVRQILAAKSRNPVQLGAKPIR